MTIGPPARLTALLTLLAGSILLAGAGVLAGGGPAAAAPPNTYDLYVTVSGSPQGAPGSQVGLSVTWGNHGQLSTRASVTYTAPADTTIVSVPPGWSRGSRTTTHVDLAVLTKGQSRSAAFTLQIAAGAPAGQTLRGGSAVVSGTFGVDSNPGNNSAGSTVRVSPAPTPTTSSPRPTTRPPTTTGSPSATTTRPSPTTSSPSATTGTATPTTHTPFFTTGSDDPTTTDAQPDPTASVAALAVQAGPGGSGGGGTSSSDIAIAVGAGVGACAIAGATVALVTTRRRSMAQAYSGDYPGTTPFEPYQPPE